MECHYEEKKCVGEQCEGEVQIKVPPNSHERKTRISIDKKKNNEKNPEFPNFAALTKEEKAVFFEALSAARKNVERTGVQARECFGTVHDEYLDYFAASSTTSFETQGTYTVSGWPPDGTASDDVLAAEEGFASVKVPNPPETNFETGSAWERLLHEDRDKMVELYLKEEKTEGEMECSKNHLEPTEETSSESWMVVNENFSFKTEEENLEKSKGMPRFEALNLEEKQMFFKILKEARKNVQERNPEMEILPLESILKRYEERNDAVVAFSMEGRTQKESKNLRIKLTLTSVDNQRLKAKAAKECPVVEVSSQKQCENLEQFSHDEPGFSGTLDRLEDDEVPRDEGNTKSLNEKGAKWETNKSTVSVAIDKKEKVNEKFENALISEKGGEIVESIMFSEAGEIEVKTISDLDEKQMEVKEEKIELRTSVILLPSEQENEKVSLGEGEKSEEEEKGGEKDNENKARLFDTIWIDADSIFMPEKSLHLTAYSNESTQPKCDEAGKDGVKGSEKMEGFHKENYVLEALAPRENNEVKTESPRMNGVASEMKERQVAEPVQSENDRPFSGEVKHLCSVENTGKDREIPKVRSSLTCPNVYLKFKENLKQASAEKQDAQVPRSISHAGFSDRKGSKSANVGQLEPPPDEKKNLKDKTSSLMLVTPSVESVSTSDSDNETLLVPMFVRKKKLPTTKIRVLQDLLKDRAEFVEGSISEFKIVQVPHEEIRSSETPTARLHVEEEDEEDEDAREERGGKSKFFKALAKLCRCGKKEVTEEENILENLKGEAVAVDVSKAVKNPASVTQNESTMEVLKAAERKKIIQKYWKTS